MYRIVQFVRHNLPFIWSWIEFANSNLFRLKYRKGLNKVDDVIASQRAEGLNFSQASRLDVDGLHGFLKRQPEDSFKFFHPHEFDCKTLSKLIDNPSFIMILAKDGDKVVGYAFIRAFANGKSFRGKIVDVDYRGRGIAKRFGIITMKIATTVGIGLYGTISKENLASMASSKSVNEIKVIEELPDNYLLIQYLPKLKD